MGKIPKLSHLQFLVLGTLRGGPLAGREIRRRLESFGTRTRGPAFYQLMARLEDGGLVEGSYHQDIIDGQIIRERHYRITADGSAAWRDCTEFYVEVIRSFGPEGSLASAQA